MPRTADEWERLIRNRSHFVPKPLEAIEYRATTKYGKTRPVVLVASDKTNEAEYVVKARGEVVHELGHVHPKSLFNDQLVGRLAMFIEAPVPEVALINVPNELIAINRPMMHMLEGVAHGSLLLRDVVDSFDIDYLDEPGNIDRFASLAVLYGWLGNDPEDRVQYLYRRVSPYLVYSADHSDSLPSGPMWSPESLISAPQPELFEPIAKQCGFSTTVAESAIGKLRSVSDEDIASAVAVAPSEWSVTMGERISLASYLADRRDHFLRMLPAQTLGDKR